MSDTSLVFNLVARERVSGALNSVKEKFSTAAAGIGAALGVGLGAAVASGLDMQAANAKLAAQLGLGSAEAAKVGKVSAGVFKQGWGESTDQVNEAIKGVYQNIGDTSQAQGGLQGVTSKVLALSQTFDQDLGGTTAAVGQLMKTGLATNADQALDIITKGFQTGADKSGDFLDTLNEYGVQFKKFGLDGSTATALISQGLKAGARDGDLVADAIKEFSIRAIDGSDTTKQGFEGIGLSASDMAAKIGKGGQTATDALGLTLDKLRGIEDPVKRNAAATALFGTQAEDLGSALFALDPDSAVKALGDVGGAAERMSKTVGDTPSQQIEKFKRTVTTGLGEIGAKLITFGTEHIGTIKTFGIAIGAVAGPILAVVAGVKLWNIATNVWKDVQKAATAVQWLWNAALAANPVVLIVAGILLLVAAIVLIATKTTWFQTAWNAIWAAIKVAFDAVVTAIKATLHWFAGIGKMFAGWFMTAYHAVVKWLSEAVTWVKGLPGRIVSALATLGSKIYTTVSKAAGRVKTALVTGVANSLTWMSGLPGRITKAVGNLGSLLFSKGQDVARGLWNGISGMGGWVASQLRSWALRIIPGPIAKVLGIHSPSTVMRDMVGAHIPTGVMAGVQAQTPALKSNLQSWASSTITPAVQTGASMATRPAAAAPMAGPGYGPQRLEIHLSGPDDFKKLIRGIVRKDGRGNVQTAFGKN